MKRYLLAILVFGVFSCQTKSADQLITTFGRHHSPDGHLQLDIQKMETSLVHFTLSRVEAQTPMSSDTIGSDAMRWWFYWSDDNTLWAYSSDSGYFKIISVTPSGNVAVENVTRTTPLPSFVQKNLPSSLLRQWKQS